MTSLFTIVCARPCSRRAGASGSILIVQAAASREQGRETCWHPWAHADPHPLSSSFPSLGHRVLSPSGPWTGWVREVIHLPGTRYRARSQGAIISYNMVREEATLLCRDVTAKEESAR